MGRLVGKRTRLAALLFAAIVVTLTAIYFHNGRCFACESNDPTAETCADHQGPCVVANVSAGRGAPRNSPGAGTIARLG